MSGHYVPPPSPYERGCVGGWGGHIVFGTDPIGVSVGFGVKLLVRFVT